MNMMSTWEYLSGNVPGGLGLLITVLLIIYFILFYIYKVNELFLKKHLQRWALGSTIVVLLAYAGIWIKNPPPHIYKRYTIDFFKWEGGESWKGRELALKLSEHVVPFKSDTEFFLPVSKLYRLSPRDSIYSQKFRERIFDKLPVNTVLTGIVKVSGDKYLITLQLLKYPGKSVKKSTQFEMESLDFSHFRKKVVEFAGEKFPFRKGETILWPTRPNRVVLEMAERFYAREYTRGREAFQGLNSEELRSRYIREWNALYQIREAGLERAKDKKWRPDQAKVPHWLRQLKDARQVLIGSLKEERNHPLFLLALAESYIWEERFEKAEVFLKKGLIENPFEIDFLINLAFLHPSRYREFGINGRREIYSRVLNLFPLEEDVLTLWCENVLKNNPSYTAPPEETRKLLQRVLEIHPYSAKFWGLYGQILSGQSRRPEALKAFLKADSLSPQSGWIHYNIGVLYYSWEKPDQAEPYFKRALEYDNYPDAYLYLGAIYQYRQQYQKALEYFRKRVALKSGEDDFYAYQAMKGIRECLQALKNGEAESEN
ncbi:MAG: hypothetical protein Kow0037_19140 [Calditrichia bacterium]